MPKMNFKKAFNKNQQLEHHRQTDRHTDRCDLMHYHACVKDSLAVLVFRCPKFISAILPQSTTHASHSGANGSY